MSNPFRLLITLIGLTSFSKLRSKLFTLEDLKYGYSRKQKVIQYI